MERIDLLAFWFLMIFGLFIPYVVIKSQRAVKAGAAIPPRPKIYRNVLIMQTVFLIASLPAIRAGRIDILTAGHIGGGAVALAVVMLALAMVASRLIWKSTSDELRRRLLISRPHEPRELGWWFLVSLAAGVVEEIVYRGVLTTLLMSPIIRFMGSEATDGAPSLGGPFTTAWCIAAGISVVAFVLGHYGQGAPRSVFLAVFSIVCHVLVRMTGSLYPAMAFHFVYDMFAGLMAIRAAREMEAAGQA